MAFNLEVILDLRDTVLSFPAQSFKEFSQLLNTVEEETLGKTSVT